MPLSGRFVILTVNILLHLANWEKFRKIYPRQVREAVNKKLTGTVLHFILALCLMWFSQYFSFISYKRDLELLSSLPLFFQLNRDGYLIWTRSFWFLNHFRKSCFCWHLYKCKKIQGYVWWDGKCLLVVSDSLSGSAYLHKSKQQWLSNEFNSLEYIVIYSISGFSHLPRITPIYFDVALAIIDFDSFICIIHVSFYAVIRWECYDYRMSSVIDTWKLGCLSCVSYVSLKLFMGLEKNVC